MHASQAVELIDAIESPVQVMMRLRAAKRLDEHQSLLIEYAFYQCRPAARPQSRRKLRSPLHMYVRHIVCDLLSEESIQQVCESACAARVYSLNP